MIGETIAKKWVDCFNRADLEGLLSLYTEDATHYSPKLKQRLPDSKGLISSKPQLRAWWADAFLRLPDLHYRLLSITPCVERVFIEYVRENPNEPDMLVAEVFELKNGLIYASRVYHG